MWYHAIRKNVTGQCTEKNIYAKWQECEFLFSIHMLLGLPTIYSAYLFVSFNINPEAPITEENVVDVTFLFALFLKRFQARVFVDCAGSIYLGTCLFSARFCHIRFFHQSER